MLDTKNWTWDRVPRPLRIMARWITIAQAAGYGVSLAEARQTVSRYASPGVMTSQELLQSAHGHLLSMTALFALSGLMFSLCTKPAEPLRITMLRLPFIAILVGFTSVWLMKYAPLLSWVLLASHVAMAFAFYFQTIATMRELRRVRNAIDH